MSLSDLVQMTRYEINLSYDSYTINSSLFATRIEILHYTLGKGLLI